MGRHHRGDSNSLERRSSRKDRDRRRKSKSRSGERGNRSEKYRRSDRSRRSDDDKDRRRNDYNKKSSRDDRRRSRSRSRSGEINPKRRSSKWSDNGEKTNTEDDADLAFWEKEEKEGKSRFEKSLEGPVPRDEKNLAENPDQVEEEEKEEEKEEVSFEPSGILAKETNTVNDVVLKFAEPQEARIPEHRWRLYVFKGDEALDPLYVHRQSCFLFGKDRRVADIPIDHPSCSRQHAVLQYREIHKVDEDNIVQKYIKPYIMDLESLNGTFLNGEKIEPARYYEILHKDVLKFGMSSRSYVCLREDLE